MIDKALDFLANSIHEYLKRLPDLDIQSETKVHLVPVIKNDGSLGIHNNTLGLSLVNIEEERVTKAQVAHLRMADDQIGQTNPQIKLNLYILITANFSDYKTGLEFLSGAIRFFQSKNVFTPHNSPGLRSSLIKLIVDLYTVNLEQQHHLWGLIGAKYLPSVMYRVRLITIQESMAEGKAPPITKIQISETVTG